MKLSAATFRRTVLALVSVSFCCLAISLYLTIASHLHFKVERDRLVDISDRINRTSMALGLSTSMTEGYLHQSVGRITAVLEKLDERSSPVGNWSQMNKLIQNALNGIRHYQVSLDEGHSQEYLDHLHIQSITLLNLILEEASRLSQVLDEKRTDNSLFLISLTAGLCVVLLLSLLCAHFLYQHVLFKPIIKAATKIRQGDLSKLMPKKRLVVRELVALMTSLERIWQQLETEATHDMLTGLPNRLFFTRRLEAVCAGLPRSGQSIAVLMIDLDDFKEVNDTMGHAVGDQLLKDVAARLALIVGTEGSLARLGGDEFAIILETMETAEARSRAEAMAQTISTAFKEPFSLNGQSIVAHLSTGIALGPNGSYETTFVLRNADIALYQAKARKRGAIAVYSEEMSREIADNLRIEAEIRAGLSCGEFFFVYQPKVDTREDRIIGIEALIRWQHPRLGVLEPRRFLGHAERSGLLPQISDYLLETVIGSAGTWRLQGRPIPMISLNIDPKFLRLGDVCRKISSLCGKHDVQPWIFCIEITEGTFFNFSPEMEEILNELRQLGVRVSIDDFGTGYSSLRYIQKLPIDELKIDRSFVRDLTGPDAKSPVLEAIIALGTGYDIDVVVEGVESLAQLNFFSERGCHVIQGYLTGRPIAADELSWQRIVAAQPARSGRRGLENVTLLHPHKNK